MKFEPKYFWMELTWFGKAIFALPIALAWLSFIAAELVIKALFK